MMPMSIAARSARPERSVCVCGRTFLCGVGPSKNTTALSLVSIVVTTRRTSALSAITASPPAFGSNRGAICHRRPRLRKPSPCQPRDIGWAAQVQADHINRGSHLPLDHHTPDLGDRLGRIETLRAGFGAIHDGVAAVEAERIFEIVEASSGRFVAAVLEPTMRLQQRGWSHEALAVPPIARARGRAARAQDALIEAIELLAIFVALFPLLLWRRRSGLQPRLDRGMLRIEVGEVGYEILHH